jgi:hypothetical protein
MCTVYWASRDAVPVEGADGDHDHHRDQRGHGDDRPARTSVRSIFGDRRALRTVGSSASGDAMPGAGDGVLKAVNSVRDSRPGQLAA